MALERERAIQKGRKLGKNVAGVPGALKRLNLQLKVQEAKKDEPKKLNMKAIDSMIDKKNDKAIAKASGKDSAGSSKSHAAEGPVMSGTEMIKVVKRNRRLSVCSKAKEKKACAMLTEKMHHQEEVSTVAAKAAGRGRHAAHLEKSVGDESALDTSDVQVREAMEAAQEASNANKGKGILGRLSGAS